MFEPRQQLRRYGIAGAVAAAFLLFQYGLVVWSGVPSLGVFYPAIFACAYFLGLGPAVLVTLLTSAVTSVTFYTPDYGYAADLAANLVRHGIYVFNSLVSAWMLNRARLYREASNRARDEADRSRRRLDDFFNKAPIPIAVLNGPDFRFELANQEYLKLLGPTRKLVGRTVAEAIPELSSEIGEVLRRVHQTGERFVGQEYPIELDWEYTGRVYKKYLNFIYEPLRGPAGTEDIIVYAYDVSELVANRKALEESEQRIRAYAEAMPQLAFIADGDGAILYYNARWYNYIGLEPGETEGWNWRDRPIHHPDDLASTIQLWQDSLATGKPYEVQYRLRRHDGEYRWHLGRATPVRNREGEIVRWFGTNTDIHEQKLVQEELSRAVRARDDFLSVAAHELRTPVTALLLQSQLRSRLLKRQGSEHFTAERLAEMFAQDQRQADRLARLMDDILDVSQLTRDRFTLQLADLSLNALAADVAERLRPLFTAKDINLVLETNHHVHATVDAVRVERAISNLLLNALKYGDGSPVTLRVAEEAGAPVLAVEDHGPGIAPADRDRIFRRFERANITPDLTGLGLGLYITRDITEAHGGQLTVESEPGVRTAFTIRLPAPGR